MFHCDKNLRQQRVQRDKRLDAYRKQLVQHVVKRFKVEDALAEEYLAKMPEETLSDVIRRFEEKV